MKSLIIYLTVCIVSFLCVGQVPKHNAYPFQRIHDSLFLPPNALWLNTNIFMDDAEVTNVQYLEYLHFLLQDSTIDAVKKAYPDSTLFGIAHRDKFVEKSPLYYANISGKIKFNYKIHHDTVMIRNHSINWYNYFSYKGNKYYPVVGITHEQAEKYCKWKSKFITDYFTNHVQHALRKLKGKKISFHYRLPTVPEWEMAASAQLDISHHPYGYTDLLIKPYKKYDPHYIHKYRVRNKAIADLKTDIKAYMKSDILNFNCMSRAIPYFEEYEAEPEFIYFNNPNRFGFYNMIGNVAEMVLTENISKGGSFMDALDKCKIQGHIGYSKPEKWLGFRTVCEVIVSD